MNTRHFLVVDGLRCVELGASFPAVHFSAQSMRIMNSLIMVSYLCGCTVACCSAEAEGRGRFRVRAGVAFLRPKVFSVLTDLLRFTDGRRTASNVFIFDSFSLPFHE